MLKGYDNWKTNPPPEGDRYPGMEECWECEGSGIDDVTLTGDPKAPCPYCDGGVKRKEA